MLKIEMGTTIVGLLAPDRIVMGGNTPAKHVIDETNIMAMEIRREGELPFYFVVSGLLWVQDETDLLFKAFSDSFSDKENIGIEERIRKFEKLLYEHGEAIINKFPWGGKSEAKRIELKNSSIGTLIFGTENELLRVYSHSLSFIIDNNDISPIVTLGFKIESSEDNYQWFYLVYVDEIEKLISTPQYLR